MRFTGQTFHRLLAAATLAGLLLAGAVGPAVAQRAAAAPAWPQVGSDLRADPDVLFGQLPNGMRYAIQKNALPPGQVAIRLLIDAGSNEEQPGQEGLAHFLEHMAFRGSTHVPENQMVVMLERLGLSFGADTNAGTSQQYTVYKFNLPKADTETVDVGLKLMREIGSELTLTQSAMDAERGVILSEERARASAMTDVGQATNAFIFEGEPLARLPIGLVEVIRTAPAERLRAFYDAYYRPEQAVLVVVGDIEPAVMEARIKAQFSDWRGRGPAGAEPVSTPKAHAERVKIIARPGSVGSLDLVWRTPPDRARESKAKESAKMVEFLGFQAMNQRFADLSQGPNPPFLVAVSSSSDVPKIAHLTDIAAVVTRPEDWGPALDALIKVQKQVLQYGVTQAEVDRVAADMRARIQAAVASNATRRSPNIADGLVSAAASESIYTSNADDMAIFDGVIKTLKLDAVNAALRARFAGSEPLVVVAGTEAPAGGAPAVNARLAQARAAPVEALAVAQTKAWTHTSFGPAGTVAERSEVADIGANFVRFANGVRLTVKPTRFTADQIQVRVGFGDGRLSFPRDRITPARLWDSAFISGGLSDLSWSEIQRTTAGKQMSIGAATQDDAFVLSGATRPADFDLQMQLLAAYFVAPGWRREGYEQSIRSLPASYALFDGVPSLVFLRDSNGAVHGGDMRWADPGIDGLSALKLEDARALMTPILASAPMEIVIVGDITVQAAIDAVAKTFGALPARSARTPVAAAARDVRFAPPTTQPLTYLHKGRADQGLAAVAWPTTGFFKDVRAPRAARVLQLILQQRVTEEFRILKGKTYSPQSNADFSVVFPDYGSITVQAEVEPGSIQNFYDTIDRIVADLAANEVSADELDRAKKPRIEALTQQRTTNAYWVSMLPGVQADPLKLDLIRDTITVMQSITAADVRNAARAWLAKDKIVRMRVIPSTGQTAPIALAP